MFSKLDSNNEFHTFFKLILKELAILGTKCIRLLVTKVSMSRLELGALYF